MGVGSEELGANPFQVTRAYVCREASRLVPTNTRGLPEGFYRSDLLSVACVLDRRSADEIINPTARKSGPAPTAESVAGRVFHQDDILILDERVLKGAYVPLSYDEGYPTLPDGRPFWSQLDFEPPESYAAFRAYLDQGTKGHRELFRLADRKDIQMLVQGVKMQDAALLDPSLVPKLHLLEAPEVPTTRDPLDPPEEELQTVQVERMLPGDVSLSLSDAKGKKLQAVTAELREWFLMYHWGLRAQAHDLFFLQSTQSRRQRLGLALDDNTYVKSTTLMKKLMGYMDGDDIMVPGSKNDDGIARFWAEMTPKTAIDMMEKLQRMQRVALGLPAASPALPSDQGLPLTEQQRLEQKSGRGALPAEADDEETGMSDDERMKRIAALVAAARSRKSAAS